MGHKSNNEASAHSQEKQEQFDYEELKEEAKEEVKEEERFDYEVDNLPLLQEPADRLGESSIQNNGGGAEEGSTNGSKSMFNPQDRASSRGASIVSLKFVAEEEKEAAEVLMPVKESPAELLGSNASGQIEIQNSNDPNQVVVLSGEEFQKLRSMMESSGKASSNDHPSNSFEDKDKDDLSTTLQKISSSNRTGPADTNSSYTHILKVPQSELSYKTGTSSSKAHPSVHKKHEQLAFNRIEEESLSEESSQVMAQRKDIPPPCFRNSQISCSPTMGLIIFILNIVLPSSGTLLSVFVDRRPGVFRCCCFSFNFTALFVFALQLLTIPLFLAGWFWSAWHGLSIYVDNRKEAFVYKHRIQDIGLSKEAQRQKTLQEHERLLGSDKFY